MQESYQVSTNLRKNYSIRKSIAWMWDMDYLGKLSEDEKGWLLKFCDEFYHGAVKKNPVPGQIHTSQEMIRDIYRCNNYRNKDLMNKRRVRVYQEDNGPCVSVKVSVPSDICFKSFKKVKKV